MQIYGFIIMFVSLVLLVGDYMMMALGYEKETNIFALIDQVGPFFAIILWASPFFISLFIIIATSPHLPRTLQK